MNELVTLEAEPFKDDLFNAYGVAEFVHYYDPSKGNLIYQRCNSFIFRLDGQEGKVDLPTKLLAKISKISRLSRRLLRTDKGNCVWFEGRKRLLIFYQFRIYTIDVDSGSQTMTKQLNFRNPLYSGVLLTGDGSVYFGEYRGNWGLEEIQIFRSIDYGDTWEVVYTFPAGSIFHVHSLMWDSYEQKIWTFTGDFEGQCKVCVSDPEFRKVEILGDGGQNWRAVNALFLEDKVVWGMDSPLSDVTINSLDRATRKLSIGQSLDGPVWFSKHLKSGGALMQTTVEHSHLQGVKSNTCSIYYSDDFIDWVRIANWEKDRYPNKYFRHGLVAFADGPQDLDDIVVNGESLKGFDGESRCLVSRVKTGEAM